MRFQGREKGKKGGLGGTAPQRNFFRGGEERQGMTADIAAEVAEGGRGPRRFSIRVRFERTGRIGIHEESGMSKTKFFRRKQDVR